MIISFSKPMKSW